MKPDHDPGHNLRSILFPAALLAGMLFFDRKKRVLTRLGWPGQVKTAGESLQELRFQHYLDRITTLILDPTFEDPQGGARARRLARAHTMVALSGLDPLRKGAVVRFLYESGMIGGQAEGIGGGKPPHIALHGADLKGAALPHANLGWVNLCGTFLNRVDFRGSFLGGANLGGADLIEADLRGATLTNANLMLADLRDANLEDADLSGVIVTAAQLSTAKNVPDAAPNS